MDTILYRLARQKKIKNHKVCSTRKAVVNKFTSFSIVYLLVLCTGPIEEQELPKTLIPPQWLHSNPSSSFSLEAMALPYTSGDEAIALFTVISLLLGNLFQSAYLLSCLSLCTRIFNWHLFIWMAFCMHFAL